MKRYHTRAIVAILFVVFGSAALFAGGKAEKSASPAQAEHHLRIYVGELTPRTRTASDRWDPPSYMDTLVERYTEMNPGVSIEILPELPAGDEFETWVTTQYLAGRGPDVGTQLFSEVHRHVARGWYLNLSPYLDEPNPYVPGNTRWRDTFLPGVINTGTGPDGNVYVIPTGLVGTAIFYNQDIFDELRLTPPRTWAEFIAIQETIKNAGYVPFAFHMAGNPYQANWALRSMQDMLFDGELGRIKGTNEPVERTTIEAEGISQKELVAAIRSGEYTAIDPRWQEQLRLLKEWSAYWDPSWLSMNVDDAHRMFVTGRSAMMWHSSGRVRPIQTDTLRRFEYGTFSFPRITSESSRFATGIDAPAIGGFTGAGPFNVAAGTVARGVKDHAIDFLRFITAPDNLIPLHADLGAYVPGVRGEFDVAPEIAPFIESLARGTFRIESFFRGLTREYSDQFVRTLQEYLLDRTSLEQASRDIQGYMDQAAAELIDLNNWDIP